MKNNDNEPASDLPEGWHVSSLMDVADFIRGVTYKTEDAKSYILNGYKAVLRANNFNDVLHLDDLVYVPETNIKTNQNLKIGDILLAISSGSKNIVGKAIFINENIDASFGAFCGVLRPKNIVNKYLGYFFCTSEYRNYVSEASTGVNINNLNRSIFESINIRISPTNEQKRIVAKIDEIFEQVAKVKESLEKSKRLVKQFRKMVLTKAFKGELVPTEAELARREGRDYETASQLLAKIKPSKEKPNTKATTPPTDNETASDLPEGWEYRQLGDISKLTRGPFGGSLKKEIFKDSGYAVYEQNHAIYNQFNEVRYYIDTDKFNEMKRFEINTDDLIMSCSGTIGKIAIVPTNTKKGIINQALLKISPTEKIISKYLKLWLESSIYQNILVDVSKGTAMQNVPAVSILKVIMIPLPRINEQKRIVAKIDELYKYADEIEAQIDFALKRSDTIKQAVLAKAFRGELVLTEAELARREGRDYEPASVLLEKIKSQAKEISEKPQIHKRTNKKGE
jgi:type I restriction enzyme S subunit